MSYRILVIDDELPNLESLERILKSDGADVHTCQNPREAVKRVQETAFDVIVTDLRMPGMNGLEFLETVKVIDPTVEVVLMTAYGTVELAVDAMKKGAYDFITKPLQRVQVLRTVHKALEKRVLVNENSALKDQLRSELSGEPREIIGNSPATRQVMDIALQAARSKASVLIEGESGTGKGLLAEFIHRFSQCSGLFVKINCTAIPDNLLEAELFGYEAGAFTGAAKRKKGRVELANDGTLFLDEIGIAPATLQSKLLRFLQDGEFERLGGVETLRVPTRLVSATNANLKKAIEEGNFREDLYYRLNVVRIFMPPLRDRSDDIPLLVKRFLEISAKKNARPEPLIHSDALERLSHYSWPGNIRELQNLMERLVVLNRTGEITIEDLPLEISGTERRSAVLVPVGLPLRDVEKLVMAETLKTTKGDKKLAARLLGIHPRTIYRYLESIITPPPPTPEVSTEPAGN